MGTNNCLKRFGRDAWKLAKAQRERERERERERDRETDRDRQRQTEREKERDQATLVSFVTLTPDATLSCAVLVNDSTNSRVVWWSFFEAALILVMTLGQVYYLHQFFEVRTIV